MKILLCILASGALAVQSAPAKIGETEAQIETRYGKSTGEIPDTTMRIYTSGEFTVFVEYTDGKSSREVIGHPHHEPITSEEQLKFSDGGKSAWYDVNQRLLYVSGH